MKSRSDAVMLAGHLPPPVNGQTVAVLAFSAFLTKAAAARGVQLRRLDITSDGPRGVRHHLVRLTRVSRVLIEMLRLRPRVLYISADAGYGMFYTLALVTAARCVRTSVYMHHHSMNYFESKDRKFAVICAVGGQSTRHLVGCERMRESLMATYGAKSVDVLPIMYAVDGELPRSAETRTMRVARQAIRIGHLSNLTVEKGLETVFAVADELQADAVPCELVIAGPTMSPSDREALERQMKIAKVPVRYLGPVRGADREEFFRLIDVFVFPTRFRRESFGLVAGEALIRGCPIVSYETACLDADVVGEGGLVLGHSEQFTERATAWLRTMYFDEERYARTVEGTMRFTILRREARERAEQLAEAIVSL
jgi:glycosyltransferase involved in cell wall biosynthesis